MADTNRPPTLDLLRALREAGHTSVGIVEDVRLTLSFVHDDVTYSCVLPVPGKGLNQKALKFPHVADVLDEATDDQRTKKFLDKIAEVVRAPRSRARKRRAQSAPRCAAACGGRHIRCDAGRSRKGP